jgi:leucyl-tRNA synthetase
MQEYNFKEIESKWQKYWQTKETYIVDEDYKKEKFYVLDMFPYPSGEGLHVGHPLGYIASDIYSRYKTLKGYNVLHPMGYDSFGLPAEQYAIQTGQHPKITTKVNINRYREQLDRIGFSYDWSREIRTSDVKYYKWTQWIFSLLFSSAYCKTQDKAIEIKEVINCFSKHGNINSSYVCDKKIDTFSYGEWNNYTDEEKEKILLYYRLAFLSDTLVNWCEELGTVLANDEVKNGVSERGGHPVEQKKMRQWSLRITAYTERLLQGLDKVDFSESLKIQQQNWIGKSKGATLYFDIDGFDEKIEVFTTRPETIFGVSFMTLAPEHPLVEKITTKEYINSVNKYVANTIKKNERERQADVNKISGEFTGAYAIHPITNKKIPIWIGDYVLISYGS